MTGDIRDLAFSLKPIDFDNRDVALVDDADRPIVLFLNPSAGVCFSASNARMLAAALIEAADAAARGVGQTWRI